nr:putative ribonuclease H-like domain-containing protein [Tanacetum cinerariifolium]
VSVVQGNRKNAVKSSACWIWRPTGNVIDHISKDSGSYMLKRFNYVDLHGRLKHMTEKSPSLLIIKRLMEDLLHLEEVLKEATIDESNLLHRRLGHINFKTMNKLVRGNLVRGLPSKISENDHTCVACQKGKQHKASWKAGQEKSSYHEYILLLFMPSSTQSLDDKDAGEVPDRGDEGVSKRSSIDDQEKTDSNAQDVGTAEPKESGIFDDVYNDREVGAEADTNNFELSTVVSPIPTTRVHKDHPKEQIIRDLNLSTQTRRMLDFSEENVMMDVKCTFLYVIIEEDVYVCQPPGFEDPHFLNKVYKVEKDLYGLHQAPRACYEPLSAYLLENGFRKGTIDKKLFIKKDRDDILLVQVYVDDIIFGSIKKSLCDEFEQIMHKIFQMSSKGELTFFLGLQVKQKYDGIYISQDKYVADILKKFDFTIVKTASTPMKPKRTLIKDAEAEDVDVHLYRSMIRSLMYLTASTPDIMFVVCACARFQVTPKTLHLHDVKTIFRYLKGKQTTLFPSMLVIQAKEGKGSGHPSEPQPPPSSAQHIHKEQIPTIVSSTHQKTQTSRQSLNVNTELPQTSVHIPNVPDEAVYEEWDDSVERATTTTASLDAAQDSGGSIAQNRSERVPTSPHDSPFPRVNTLRSDEGSMLLQELTALCTTLSNRVLALETDLRQTKKVYGTTYTKLIMKVKKMEKTVSSQEDRPKDQLGVLSAAKVLADAAKKKVNTYIRRKRAVSTGSEGVSTTSRIFSTAKESVSTAESEQPKKIKKRVQIQMILDEELAQKLYEEEQTRFNAEPKAKFNAEQEELLIQADEELAQKIYGKKRTKKAGLNLQEESSKRQKTEEGSELTEEPKADEISQEDLQQIMMIVPVEEVYVEALQVKYPIIDWERFDRDDLVRLWDLVKEMFNTTDPIDDKEKALWVELKILFEPDNDDILWKL